MINKIIMLKTMNACQEHFILSHQHGLVGKVTYQQIWWPEFSSRYL